MTEEYYTSEHAPQPRIPLSSRIVTNIDCPHCREHGLTEGPNFALMYGRYGVCGRCSNRLPPDSDLPVHGAVAAAIGHLVAHQFHTGDFVQEEATVCDTVVQQHRLELANKKGITATIRWFELERAEPLIGVDWRSWFPNPGQTWSLGLGSRLSKQGLHELLYSPCHALGLAPTNAFKLTDRRLSKQVDSDQLFLRLEHRSKIGLIPGTPAVNVFVVVRIELKW